MPWKHALISVILAALTLAAGCAPKSRSEGVAWVARKHKATDAKLQRVTHRPALRVDAASLALLEEAQAEPDLERARSLAARFVQDASAAALDSTRLELERLDDAGWREINARYYQRDVVPDARARREIIADLERDSAEHSASLEAELRAAPTTTHLRRQLASIRGSVEPSVKTAGRLARVVPWLPFTLPSLMVIANINSHEWRGPQDAPFDSAARYSPSAVSAAFQDARHGELLARYAPVIVQEIPAAASYPASVDQLGRVTATARDDMAIDVSAPTVYAYSREIRVHGSPHVQLVYTHWYPEHPALKKNDPEHGRPEGVTLRLTLDRDHRPAMMETVYNCGCYHRLYPTAKLEADARDEFGAPQSNKSFSIERNVPLKIDMIVPKAVDMTNDGRRPVIRCRAGWHGIVDVAFTEGEHAKEVVRRLDYTLRPYDELERLALPGGGVTSMFYDNGLVKKAQRPEGVFFTPAGLLSAGQPRQRGTQMIHWDHYDFDDPHLFERTLRLPSSF